MFCFRCLSNLVEWRRRRNERRRSKPPLKQRWRIWLLNGWRSMAGLLGKVLSLAHTFSLFSTNQYRRFRQRRAREDWFSATATKIWSKRICVCRWRGSYFLFSLFCLIFICIYSLCSLFDFLLLKIIEFFPFLDQVWHELVLGWCVFLRCLKDEWENEWGEREEKEEERQDRGRGK